MLRRLAALPAHERVAIFTHGYFMQAVRLVLLFPGGSDRDRMGASRMLNDRQPIANTEIIQLHSAGGTVTAIAQEHITPMTFEPVNAER